MEASWTTRQTRKSASAIALSRDYHEVWFAFGDTQIETSDGLKPVAAVENLITGERWPVEWGGIRLHF